jgi:hypothetical protein
MFVIDLEAQRGHKVKRGVGCRAEARDASRVGRDFGLEQNDMHLSTI